MLNTEDNLDNTQQLVTVTRS